MKSNVVVDWNLLFSDNRSAVEKFAQGGSLRNMIKSLTTNEARSLGYQIERTVGSEKARTRAKRALSRNK